MFAGIHRDRRKQKKKTRPNGGEGDGGGVERMLRTKVQDEGCWKGRRKTRGCQQARFYRLKLGGERIFIFEGVSAECPRRSGLDTTNMMVIAQLNCRNLNSATSMRASRIEDIVSFWDDRADAELRLFVSASSDGLILFPTGPDSSLFGLGVHRDKSIIMET